MCFIHVHTCTQVWKVWLPLSKACFISMPVRSVWHFTSNPSFLKIIFRSSASFDEPGRLPKAEFGRNVSLLMMIARPRLGWEKLYTSESSSSFEGKGSSDGSSTPCGNVDTGSPLFSSDLWCTDYNKTEWQQSIYAYQVLKQNMK